MQFHLKVFCAVIACSTMHASFGMEQPRQGLFARLKNHLYTACNLVGRSAVRSALAIKKLAVTSMKWAWNRKAYLAVLLGFEAAGEYFEPSNVQEEPVGFAGRLFSGSMQLCNYANMAFCQSDYYIRYKDQDGIECRCYSQEEPEKFEQLYIGGQDATDDETPGVIFDKRRFFLSLCEEVGTDLFYTTLSRALPFKIGFNPASGSTFCRRVALRTGGALIRLGVQHGIIIPCMKFGLCLRRKVKGL